MSFRNSSVLVPTTVGAMQLLGTSELFLEAAVGLIQIIPPLDPTLVVVLCCAGIAREEVGFPSCLQIVSVCIGRIVSDSVDS